MYTLDQVTALLDSHGIQTIPRDMDNVSILCPFCPEHDPDIKGKCYVTPGKWNGIYRCFKCDSSGTIRSLFRHFGIPVAGSVLSMEQMAERIAKVKTSRMFERSKLPKQLSQTKIPDEYIALSEDAASGYMAKKAATWLARRGIHWDQIRRWQIGYCPHGYFAHQLKIG